jgi:UDP-N-acetyl-D-mannosaminuronic acid transferase (WecB/TagA/CpsF family)
MVHEHEHQDQLQSMISRFFNEKGIASLLKRANIRKADGVPVTQVFQFLFQLVFSGRSLSRVLKDPDAQFQKDTVYRLLHSPRHNWRRFLLLLAQMTGVPPTK